MAAAETARLIASLELQDKNFTRGIRNVERGVNRVDKKLGAFSGFVNRNVGRALDTMAVKLVGAVGTGLEEMATLEDAATSVAGAITQVGKGWTITADDVVEAANRIESETDAAFDDKAIVAATETLIRYGKVSENNLEPAMEVMTDLAARTGDVESAATLLGKALADPAKAAGKLARSGVVLTKAQQKQIKAMVEAGDVAGAQTFLLEELRKTTEGAAAASAGPYRDALNKLGDAGEDLRRGFVTGLAPAILEVSDLLTDELAKPSTMDTLKNVGKELGSALKGLIGIAKSLPWESIGNAMRLAGTGAKAILDAFLGLPPWIQTAVLTGWGLNKITGGALTDIFGNLASGLIKGVLGMNAGVVNINAGVVNGAGGVPGAAGGAAAGAGRMAQIGNAVRILGAVSIAGASIAALAHTFGDVRSQSEEQAKGAAGNLDRMLANNPTLSSMLQAQRATRDAINRMQTDPIGAWIAGDTVPTLRAMDAKLSAEINATQGAQNAIKNAQSIASREAVASQQRIDAVKASVVAAQVANSVGMAIQAAKTAMLQVSVNTQGARTANASTSAGARVAAAQAAAASRIVGAINALDLSVNVTTVNRTSTINNRYGPSGGSSTTNRSGELE